MGMKTRQDKANEIRDYVTKINSIVAELEEEGYEVGFQNGTRRYSTRTGKISKVTIEKTVSL